MDTFTEQREKFLADKYGIKDGKLQIEPMHNRAANIQQSAQDYIDSAEKARERDSKQYTAYGNCNHKSAWLGKLFLDIIPDR